MFSWSHGTFGSCIVLYLFTFLPVVLAEDCGEAARVISAGRTLAVASAEAKKAFSKASQLCPSLSESKYYLALHFLAVGDTKQAKAKFDSAYQTNKDVRYRLGSARAALESGIDDEARVVYQEILSENPNQVDALQGLAVSHYRAGEFQKSEELLRRALQQKPNKAALFVNLGMTLEKRGRLDEAIVSYRTAISKAPQYGLAYQRLTQAFLGLGRLNDAEKSSDSAVLYAPESGEVWLLKASVLEAKGNLEEALLAVKKAGSLMSSETESKSSQLGSSPKLADSGDNAVVLMLNLGILQAKLGLVEEALLKLEKALKIAPENSATNGALGWFYLKQAVAGRNTSGKDYFDLSENALRKAIEIDNKNAFAHNNLGVLLESTGRNKLAIESFARAKEVGPNVSAAIDNHKRLVTQSAIETK